MVSRSIQLKILLEQPGIRMLLIQGNRVLDFETVPYYHNLDDMLITALDKLLKRNKLDATGLKSFKILEKTGKNSTSYKIAAAFVEGLKVKV